MRIAMFVVNELEMTISFVLILIQTSDCDLSDWSQWSGVTQCGHDIVTRDRNLSKLNQH